MQNLILTFVCGGIICLFAQLLIDLTKLTPARILVLLVTGGVLLYATGIYDYLFSIFGCGVSVPLIGFGAAIGRGVKEAVDSTGILGSLTGALTATSAGITAALFLGFFFSLFGKGRAKRL